MSSITKNWRTTVMGILVILISIMTGAQGVIGGQTMDWNSLVAQIIAGLGLVIAKDSNVTGT